MYHRRWYNSPAPFTRTMNSLRTTFRLFCFLAIALCALSVHAQSGRRQAKVIPAAPVPTPTPEPTPIPKKEQKDAELLFFVGADHQSSYYSFPLAYYDAAMRGCVERLRSGSSASVDVTEKSLNRSDAIKRAKAEGPDSYVVMLKLALDSMARSYDDMVLEFVVFAPRTAKTVAFGRSYMNANRKGPIVVGPKRFYKCVIPRAVAETGR